MTTRLQYFSAILLLFPMLPGWSATTQSLPLDLTTEKSPKAMVVIPAGSFLMGSSDKAREYGYQLDEARGSDAARKYRWFDNETQRTEFLPAYQIDRFPVTNVEYEQFILATSHRAPFVSREMWKSYGLIHPYTTVTRFLWRNKHFPPGRGRHPVVLASMDDAAAYCEWRGKQQGRVLRLPNEKEWEKAARGTSGNRFPWGNEFDASRLNSADEGPYDTMPVGQFQQGVSPYGVYDMAGMVFEWTATQCPGGPGRIIVKGGSWDDYPGVTRSAARHCRPGDLKHVLIGFRCAADLQEISP